MCHPPQVFSCMYTFSCLDNTSMIGQLIAHSHFIIMFILTLQDIDFGHPLYRFGIRPGRQDPSLFFVTDTSKHHVPQWVLCICGSPV